MTQPTQSQSNQVPSWDGIHIGIRPEHVGINGKQLLKESMQAARAANRSEAFQLGVKTVLAGTTALVMGGATALFSDETSSATKSLTQGVMAGGLSLVGAGAKIIYDAQKL